MNELIIEIDKNGKSASCRAAAISFNAKSNEQIVEEIIFSQEGSQPITSKVHGRLISRLAYCVV